MKEQRFGINPRLRLCLILTMSLSSCAIFKSTETIAATSRVYRLTVEVPPGRDLSTLFSIAGNFSFDQSNKVFGLPSQDERITLLIRVDNDAAFNAMNSQLAADGIRVIGLVRQLD